MIILFSEIKVVHVFNPLGSILYFNTTKSKPGSEIIVIQHFASLHGFHL